MPTAAPGYSIRKWASRDVGSTASRVELAARQLEHAPALVIAHAVPLAGAASDDDAVDTLGDEAPEKRAEAVLVDVAVLADLGDRNDEHALPIGSALGHLLFLRLGTCRCHKGAVHGSEHRARL